MDFKGVRRTTRQISSIAFHIGLAFLAIVNTVMISISDASIWEKLEQLGSVYLGLGILYGMFRLYRYIFHK